MLSLAALLNVGWSQVGHRAVSSHAKIKMHLDNSQKADTFLQQETWDGSLFYNQKCGMVQHEVLLLS